MVLVHIVYGNWSDVGYLGMLDQTSHCLCMCTVRVTKAENQGQCYGWESHPIWCTGSPGHVSSECGLYLGSVGNVVDPSWRGTLIVIKVKLKN